MNSKTFLSKINVWNKLINCAKHRNYLNHRFFSQIKPNYEHKSRINFLFKSLFSTKNRVLFVGQTRGTILTIRRNLSEDKESEEETSIRPLMEFKPILFPNLWFKWKNFLSINTIIRPFFDNEFNINHFMTGAKQALVHISNCLADGDIQSLKGLISEDALSEIQKNYSLMTATERQSLRVDFDDIFLSFPYRIGIIMNDDERRWVEITVVYYCLYKYKSLIQSKQLSFEDFKQKFSKNIMICNYRFIREYTKGVESEWTINLLGHFKNINSF